MTLRWRVLWIIWILVVGLVTTLPWRDLQGLQGHPHWANVRWIPFYAEPLSLRVLFDIATNFLLFLPFGYLYVRTRFTERGAALLHVTLWAALLSAGAELAQVFSHTRIPSMTDIFTNVIGAMIGAGIARKTSKEK